LVDACPACLEVEREPSQAEQLAASHPGRGRQPPEGEQAIVGDVAEESAELLLRPSSSFALRRRWWICGCGRIARELPPTNGVPQDADLVSADELGRPINPTRVTEAFLRHRKALGLTVGTLHTLRHTHTTLALSHGVPVHVVAARIGDRPETVLRTLRICSRRATRKRLNRSLG
jgi:integrase